MEKALEAKVAKHKAAVSRLGHEFIPIGISVFGEFHGTVDKFLRRVLYHLPESTKSLAILQTKRAMSEAWMIGTIAMMQATTREIDHFGESFDRQVRLFQEPW